MSTMCCHGNAHYRKMYSDFLLRFAGLVAQYSHRMISVKAKKVVVVHIVSYIAFQTYENEPERSRENTIVRIA